MTCQENTTQNIKSLDSVTRTSDVASSYTSQMHRFCVGYVGSRAVEQGKTYDQLH